MALFNPISFRRVSPNLTNRDVTWKLMLLAGLIMLAISSHGLWNRARKLTEPKAGHETSTARHERPKIKRDAFVRTSSRNGIQLSRSQE